MRKILLALALLISVAYGQTVPTSAKTAINKALYTSPNVPATQGFYYDTTNFKWSEFISVSEILNFYSTSIAGSRFGHFNIYAKIGGTRTNGVVTGGTYHTYWFKNGFADSNLVEVTTPALFDGTVSSAQNRPRKTDGSLVDSAILIASDIAALLPTKNITDSVAFFGYWFKTVKQGLPCMTTINNGTYFRGAVKGTATISIKLVGTIGNPNPPMVGYSVDGSHYTYITTSNGISTVTIATGLDTSVTHTFKVIVKSIDENYDRWTNADNGVNIAAIYIDAGATVVPLGSVASALFFGDSITNGDLIYTHTLPNPDLVAAGNGAINYVQLLGAKLNEDVYQHGMGGTGWFIPAYNVPPFPQNAFYLYAGHPVGVLKNIDKVFLNIGTNSGGQTANNVARQIDSFTIQVNAHCPTAEKIMIIPVGYKYYGTEAGGVGDSTRAAGKRNGWTILDGSKYPDNVITYSDGNVHPDSAGSVALTNLFYADYLKQHSPPTNTTAGHATYTDGNGVPSDMGFIYNFMTGEYTFNNYSIIHLGVITQVDGQYASAVFYNTRSVIGDSAYQGSFNLFNTNSILNRGDLTNWGNGTFGGNVNAGNSFGLYNNAGNAFVPNVVAKRNGPEVLAELQNIFTSTVTGKNQHLVIDSNKIKIQNDAVIPPPKPFYEYNTSDVTTTTITPTYTITNGNATYYTTSAILKIKSGTGSVAVTVNYTDEEGTNKTYTFTTQQNAFASPITGIGTYNLTTIPLNCGANSSFNYTFTVSGTVSYNLYVYAVESTNLIY